MSTDQHLSIAGIVRNGVIVPQIDHPLLEGSHVEIVLEARSVPPELVSEISAWERASEEAWSWIDDLESKSE